MQANSWKIYPLQNFHAYSVRVSSFRYDLELANKVNHQLGKLCTGVLHPKFRLDPWDNGHLRWFVMLCFGGAWWRNVLWRLMAFKQGDRVIIWELFRWERRRRRFITKCTPGKRSHIHCDWKNAWRGGDSTKKCLTNSQLTHTMYHTSLILRPSARPHLCVPYWGSGDQTSTTRRDSTDCYASRLWMALYSCQMTHHLTAGIFSQEIHFTHQTICWTSFSFHLHHF